MYQFISALLFVVELSTVFTVAAVALAHEHAVVTVQPEVIASVSSSSSREVRIEIINKVDREWGAALTDPVSTIQSEADFDANEVSESLLFDVPFYSQFTDISSVHWQKVGCGIASVAMIIDHYSDEPVSVDELLARGIQAGAYIESAGWSHAGLLDLSRAYGLDGESVSLVDLSGSDAFAELETVLVEGPVMVSVHYTFEPTNPIPHLVVIRGVQDGKVFYNDPAEPAGGGVISVDTFINAWKKRYIIIRPVV